MTRKYFRFTAALRGVRGVARVHSAAGVLLLVLLLAAGCVASPPNGIMQVSTIEALQAGVFDGHMSLMALRQYGDMGLGTYEDLDGGMVLLNGTFYKVRYDGTVVTPPASELTPFAAVTHFVADSEGPVAGVDMAGLGAAIDALVPQANVSVAFLVRGTFDHIRTRSVPPQEKPYPPLAEAIKNQAVFDLENVEGTLVGFRLPTYVQGVNVTGYHMHFLTSDGSKGGHVLELALRGNLQLDTTHDWLSIYTPTENAAFAGPDLTKDPAQ